MSTFYTDEDSPSLSKKEKMWSSIEKELPGNEPMILNLHWKSFWVGQAAAVLLLLASVGLYVSVNSLSAPGSDLEHYQQTLAEASNSLSSLKPLMLNQANEVEKPALESTIAGIEEIDRLIEELKNDIVINGLTPSKQFQMKRLYATKLDFYKELLLTNQDQL